MNRKLDPITFADAGTVWSDYDGDQIYGDFEMVSGSPVNKRSFEPGIARTANPLTSPATDYYHGDMLGTTRLMSNPSGSSIEPAAYTAFGERISAPTITAATRYGYVGAWGYDQNADFPFLHVGARYYDPSSGRFLQRDPIGIKGGTNVYAYVFNRPTVGVDPTGNGFWGDVWSGVKIAGGVILVGVGGALIGAGMIGTSPVWATGIGLAVFVGGMWIAISEIADIWDTADKIVDPIRPGVKRRNKALDRAMDCYPSG